MESKNQDQIMNELFAKYNLVFDKDDIKNSDVFVSSRYKIITRSGIDKIQAALNPEVNFDVIFYDPFETVIRGTFKKDGVTIETIGEASVDRIQIASKTESKEVNGSVFSRTFPEEIVLKKGNVRQDPPYLGAMAEKRARSRGILRLAGLYNLGFYGEDESEDFSNEIRSQKSKVKIS